MIISQTPYRVSFAGGGTDLPAFYRHEAGAVLSVALNRHMYVSVHARFEPNIRVAYSRTETVDHRDGLEHELVRETLRLVGLDEPLEVTTIGDVPAGTGMGSSSSLTVGLLSALYGYRGQFVSRERLAREACLIEIDVLAKPIGRQDQYAAAYGGLNVFRFRSDDEVEVEPVPCRAETLAELERRSLLLFTGQTRSADLILRKQAESTADKRRVLRKMRDLVEPMAETLSGRADLDGFAKLLHSGWEMKRSLGCGITNTQVDEWYRTARLLGAQGGKLLGAGGGGFLYLLAPPDRHAAICAALGEPRRLDFRVDRQGSRCLFTNR
jgi:D-glycero-alpha-D-manno-heptose-7-phosphate kinase